MHDWADENKKTLKALGPILATPTYIDCYRRVMPGMCFNKLSFIDQAEENSAKIKKSAFEDNADSGDDDELDDSDEEESSEPDESEPDEKSEPEEEDSEESATESEDEAR